MSKDTTGLQLVRSRHCEFFWPGTKLPLIWIKDGYAWRRLLHITNDGGERATEKENVEWHNLESK